MMAAPLIRKSLIDRLPPVRGRYRENADLAATTWFRVGGPAEVLFRPADADDLAAFLKGCPGDVPVTVIGVGSNLLVRDGGVRGVVIRLGRTFAAIGIDGTTVKAGAGALDGHVARAAAAAGLAGLEFLAGIPGTIGGAVAMNGGAYGQDMQGALIEVLLVESDGTQRMVAAAALDLGYRRAAIPEGAILIEARLKGHHDAPEAIAERIARIQESRQQTQPVRSRTGGSTFRNPEGARAWELIEAAGCRGLCLGGAQVSEQHCNFLINTGNASAADLEALGEEVRRRVHAATGILLEWEIRRIGVAGSGSGGEPR